MKVYFSLAILLPAVLAARTQVVISLASEDQSVQPHAPQPADKYTKFAPIYSIANNSIGQSSEQELISAVKNNFFDKFPGSIIPASLIGGIAGERDRKDGQYVQTNVLKPDLDTCKPRISKFVQLAQGIHCGLDKEKCEFVYHITIRQSYATALGLSASATVTFGASGAVFSAEMAFTLGITFDQTWTSEEEQGSEYHFDLKPGTSCIPGMIHVELECQAKKDMYFWDTYWDSYLRLEYDVNRHEKEAPYGYRDDWNDPDESSQTGNQYCTVDKVKESFWSPNNYNANLWKQIDAEDLYRGFAYIGDNADLNALRDLTSHLAKKGDFRSDEMIVHRGKDLETSASRNVIFRCLPARKNREIQRSMTIPLKGENGALQGYIGCI